MQKRFMRMGAGGFLFALIVVAWFLFPNYLLQGNCMEPTLRDGQRYWFNRLAYSWLPPKAGDLIVFQHEGKKWVSRIVATEGETVQLQKGQIRINGEMREDGVPRNWESFDKTGLIGIKAPICVPVGHVFVFSDNLKAEHDDSRVFGQIPFKDIEAKKAW